MRNFKIMIECWPRSASGELEVFMRKYVVEAESARSAQAKARKMALEGVNARRYKTLIIECREVR